MSNVNIAKNNRTIFIAVDLENLNREVLEEVNDYLLTEYNKHSQIPPVDDDEQREIEEMLNNLTDEDREIVEVHHYKVKGNKYERVY